MISLLSQKRTDMFKKRTPIPSGAQAPDFTLTDTRGNLVRLADFRGAKHVALVFARGFV